LTGFTVAPIVPGKVLTDPDPRGPCGAPIAQPLDVPADQATAAEVKITPAGQPGGIDTRAVVIRDGGALSVTIFIGAQPRPGELDALARKAASRLRAVASWGVTPPTCVCDGPDRPRWAETRRDRTALVRTG